jgi:hypothetical protein
MSTNEQYTFYFCDPSTNASEFVKIECEKGTTFDLNYKLHGDGIEPDIIKGAIWYDEDTAKNVDCSGASSSLFIGEKFRFTVTDLPAVLNVNLW